MNLRGKKIHLCEYETNDVAEALKSMINRGVAIPRIRHGFKQTLDTLISEEASPLAMSLQEPKIAWIPRMVLI